MAWIEKRKLKDGTIHRYVYERVGGKKVCKSAGPDHGTAKAIKRKVEEQVYMKNNNIVDRKKTLQNVINDYIEICSVQNKPRTLQIQEYSLKKLTDYFPHKYFSEITAFDLMAFRDNLLKNKNSNGNKHGVNGTIIILRHVKPLFKFALQRNYHTVDPAVELLKKLKPKKAARVLTYVEIDKIQRSCKFNPELLKIVNVALGTGMRLGEVLRLEKEWFNGSFVVMPREIRKTDEAVSIPIHKNIRHIFEESKPGPIFKGWGHWRLERAFRRAVKRSDIGKVRFHDLRHTFCAMYLRNGGDLGDLKEITGHKSLASLQIYVHYGLRHLQEKLDRMNFSYLKPKEVKGDKNGNNEGNDARRSEQSPDRHSENPE